MKQKRLCGFTTNIQIHYKIVSYQLYIHHFKSADYAVKQKLSYLI